MQVTEKCDNSQRLVLENEFDRLRKEYCEDLNKLRSEYQRKFVSLLEAIRLVDN